VRFGKAAWLLLTYLSIDDIQLAMGACKAWRLKHLHRVGQNDCSNR